MKLNQRCGRTLFTVLMVVAGTTQISAAIPTAERNALIDLYNSTGGINWTHNAGWVGDPGTECSWERVTCDDAGTTVTRIDLHYSYLVGPVPASLSALTGLRYLNLNDNYLSGSIPASWGGLSSLTHLIIRDSGLTGSIPTELGSISTLQWLDLSDNELTGSIPASLGNLTLLRFLDLSWNDLTGSIPASLGSLSHLENLWLFLNDLSGSIPSELGNLSNLENLLLRDNELSGPIPPELGDLSFLLTLDLSSNQLTGSIPESLGDLSNLTELSLSSNQLSGSIPASLGGLSNLTRLLLGSNQLTGSIPPELGDLSNLVWLSLSDNQLTGSIPAEIGDLTGVQSMFLSRNQLSGPIPAELGDMTSLQYLWMVSNKFVGEIPAHLMNLTIYNQSGHVDWNGLYTDDPSLIAFLNQKFGPTWAATQTVAPANVVVTAVSDHSVWLSWDPVSYGDPGGYNLYVSPAGAGSWTLVDWTADKSTTQFPVAGLDPDTPYDFAVGSFTEPHASNLNLVVSDGSAPAMATTSDGGCAEPVVQWRWGDEVTLSVGGSFDSYQWSTGETTPTIVVPVPPSPRWYWVTVTAPGSCEETATALLDSDVFSDGFEAGDTSDWSASNP
jgi:Leucine-rich repeat (LRR) protein